LYYPHHQQLYRNPLLFSIIISFHIDNNTAPQSTITEKNSQKPSASMSSSTIPPIAAGQASSLRPPTPLVAQSHLIAPTPARTSSPLSSFFHTPSSPRPATPGTSSRNSPCSSMASCFLGVPISRSPTPIARKAFPESASRQITPALHDTVAVPDTVVRRLRLQGLGTVSRLRGGEAPANVTPAAGTTEKCVRKPNTKSRK
jgi:hypothetical protein